MGSPKLIIPAVMLSITAKHQRVKFSLSRFDSEDSVTLFLLNQSDLIPESCEFVLLAWHIHMHLPEVLEDYGTTNICMLTSKLTNTSLVSNKNMPYQFLGKFSLISPTTTSLAIMNTLLTNIFIHQYVSILLTFGPCHLSGNWNAWSALPPHRPRRN